MVKTWSKNTFWQLFVGSCASIGPFALGFDDGWSAPATPSIRKDVTLNATDDQIDWIVSGIPIGCTIGGFIGFISTNLLGRRGTMLFISPVYVLSHLLAALSNNFWWIFIGRILAGIVDIVVCMAAQIYTSEIASPELRGIIASLPAVFGVAGILCTYILGTFMDWRTMTLVELVIPVSYLSMLFHVESPVWLLQKGKIDIARKAIKSLRGSHADINEELNRIKENNEKNQNKGDFSMRDVLRPQFYKPMILSLFMMFFQMFSGYGPIIYNSVEILQSGDTTVQENFASITMAVLMLAVVICSSLFVDNAGRKILLIISGIMLSLSLVTLGIYFYMKETSDRNLLSHLGWIPFASLLLYYASYSSGYFSVPYILLSEMSPARYRDIMCSIGYFASNLFIFVGVRSFPHLKYYLGSYGAFWLFMSNMIVANFFVLFFIPETKGLSLEQVEALFTNEEAKVDSNTSQEEGIGNTAFEAEKDSHQSAII
ncbi:facilitated trehalose transporter Tret1-like [Artemia franciscana]|uniref:facilitated trehalose transporter Tret1-like n=1 Tax=Artemia franciscana TaxID=6661 RepID=UPI0032D9CA15